MRLVILLAGDDLFVEGGWASVYGQHSRRLTEQLPDDVREAAQTLAIWGNEYEPTLRQEVERARAVDELSRDIARLQAQLDALRA